MFHGWTHMKWSKLWKAKSGICYIVLKRSKFKTRQQAIMNLNKWTRIVNHPILCLRYLFSSRYWNPFLSHVFVWWKLASDLIVFIWKHCYTKSTSHRSFQPFMYKWCLNDNIHIYIYLYYIICICTLVVIYDIHIIYSFI